MRSSFTGEPPRGDVSRYWLQVIPLLSVYISLLHSFKNKKQLKEYLAVTDFIV